MDQTKDHVPLSTPLPRPQKGSSARVSCGTNELVLEAVRGGYSLLWLDGRESRRFAIGLGPTGALSMVLRAPRMPLRVVVREVLTLAPGGRLHGYLQVPLVPTILWQPEQGPAQALIELPLRDLAAEWDDRAGTVFRTASSLHVRFPMRSGEPRATVPVWLANPTADVACPGYVPLALQDEELVELRGSVVATPRRLRWNGESLATTMMRRDTGVLG